MDLCKDMRRKTNKCFQGKPNLTTNEKGKGSVPIKKKREQMYFLRHHEKI